MSELEFALLRTGLVALSLVTAVDFERRTGEIPNLVPLAALVGGIVAGAGDGRMLDSIGGTVLLGIPAVVAYLREHLRPDAAKYAIGLGACLGLVGSGVTLFLGALWVRGLAQRKDAWRRAHRPAPRLSASPRIAVLASVGAAVDVARTLL
ncbi:MAG: hypothetical protein OHK0013_49870 [Sandaracinaceae bacterium]